MVLNQKSHMMSTAAFIGLGSGKRLLNSSLYYSDVSDKLSGVNDYGLTIPNAKKNIIKAKNKSSSNNRCKPPIARAIKEKHVDDLSTVSDPLAAADIWVHGFMHTEEDNDVAEGSSLPEFSVDAILSLQKCMLEKQWNLSPETIFTTEREKELNRQILHTVPKRSARKRRIDNKRRLIEQRSLSKQASESKYLQYDINQELLQDHIKGYVKGLTNEVLLTHSEVVELSKLIKTDLYLAEKKLRLKKRLGCEPSDEQLANSLRISRGELQLKLIECTLAREKLAMSNVRLVMSIAQKYDNMGAEMSDLIQGGLIGLLRGIEKFDSSKGFKISTYVYWWIRQGVSRALVESSRTLRLPIHMHERLSLIRNAKMKLQEKGIAPSISRIAASLNMSQQKVKNATEASNKVFSLDREAFFSLNGLPGETHHSYIADNSLENNPWHGVDEQALKDEVNRLINTTLRQRESDIIRLYYGLDNECLTWEDISKRIGLSRERVRQVGLVALEKLKHAARKRSLGAMLVKY